MTEIVKVVSTILIIICLLWIFSTMINHSMARTIQNLEARNKALISGCDAFMKIMRLIRKNLKYTQFKDCPTDDIFDIINDSIKMIDETEKAYNGGQNGIHKQI